MPLPRIVSLLPSATEIVCALGRGGQLVGRSHECDFPAEVSRLPACTSANLDPTGSSIEIDRQVKALLKDALSIYSIDSDLIRSLKPDVVVTQDQCEVCAVSLAEVEAMARERFGDGLDVVSLRANRLEDIFDDIKRAAVALQAVAEGERLIASLRARIAVVQARTRSLPRPSIACIEWIEPPMASGNWVPELVALAGGRNTLTRAGEPSAWFTLDDLAAVDPDVIAILPCGFDLPRTRREAVALTSQPGWVRLRAVREKRVFGVDGNQYFNRPGPRFVDSLEMLAEMLHGQVFGEGFQGVGWEHLQT
jgi:iron complex transport system substrate-binding protein